MLLFAGLVANWRPKKCCHSASANFVSAFCLPALCLVLCSTFADAQYGSNPFRRFMDRIRPNRQRERQQDQRSENRGERGGRDGESGLCQTNDGFPGQCQPVGLCFFQFGSLEEVNANRCPLGRDHHGVCCPTKNIRPTDDVPFHFDPPEWPVIRLPIDKRQIIRAVERTEDDIIQFLTMETNFIDQGYYQRPNSMASIHQSVFGPPNENLQKINLNGFRALQVTRFLGRRFHLGPLEMRDGLSQFDLYGTEYEQYCPTIPRCNPRDKYRTLDGSCNHPEHPIWGKSNTQFSRIIPPSYSDGISEFRRSVNGGPLPLARVLSTELTFTSSQPDPILNVMFMQWGQFLDHDMTLGSNTRAANGQGLLCCNRTHLEDPVFHPACRPIIIPKRDPFYARFNRRCNNFVRNAVGPTNNCNLGYREQTNVITSYLDASMVYGNGENRSRIVRTFKDGLLRVSQINRREFLPYDTMNNSIACAIRGNLPGDAQRRCVFAGDVRVNQQIGLVSLQLFFLREHNRLVRELKKINRHWSDETLFQEGRRIVGAEIQQITYNEWLPLALGRSAMKSAKLFLQPQGHCNGHYDPHTNPAILNEFAAAAFRWHTLVHGFYQLMSANGQVRQTHQMRSIFNNPSLMYRDGAIDEVTYGLLAGKAEAFDPIFVDDLKNFLFPAGNASFGTDLISVNIQRGRDHGLPPYNEMRKACGLQPARNFRQLNTMLRPGMAEKFAQIYDHVDDIDLFVGGVNEELLPEGILGPTFSCIVTEQFRRLKYGDRFWFENGGMAHSFSRPQLNELRKVTLAGVLCANGDRMTQIQPFAMLAKSRLNQNIDCKRIPQIDLRHWKE